MNPDGNQLGTRANANGVDLNRNFASKIGKLVARYIVGAPKSRSEMLQLKQEIKEIQVRDRGFMSIN